MAALVNALRLREALRNRVTAPRPGAILWPDQGRPPHLAPPIWTFRGMPKLHLLKLCVGADTVEDLLDWQAARRAEAPDRPLAHVTRMWPKREAEILAGGSIYWVIRGVILARQRIVALEPVEGADGIRRCAIVLDPAIHRTRPAPRRPFQGWRYLDPADSPADLSDARAADDRLPPELDAALAAIGVL